MPLKQMLKQIDLCIVSNLALEPFLSPLLTRAFERSSVAVSFHYIGWEEALNGQAELQGCSLLAVVQNLDTQYPDWHELSGAFDDLQDKLVSEAKKVYKTLKGLATCPVLWFGYEGEGNPLFHVCGSLADYHRFVAAVNWEIFLQLGGEDVYLDMRHLVASIGLKNAFDANNRYRWNMPYSLKMLQAMAEEIHKQYCIFSGLTKKCLVLDCDGVLWGGTLAEDGASKILLGNEGLGFQYQEFQRFLLYLYRRGVLLAICSKNDLQDVLEVFRTHSGMLLREHHIACFQVNWESKVSNIRRISEKMGIGLDQMVFVDDAESELAAVRELLPEVLTIPYCRNSVYEALSCFSLRSKIDPAQVERRMDTYRTNRKREDLRKNSANLEAYQLKLDTHIDIHPALLSETARISELSQRANRCTNGKRYSSAEILACLEDPAYRLFSVCVSDKFSDLGLVGAMGIRENMLDFFVLSCRALGRGVEDVMNTYVKELGITEIDFISTEKNGLIKELLLEKI